MLITNIISNIILNFKDKNYMNWPIHVLKFKSHKKNLNSQ